ncbi:MAG: rod-binding protein [Oligoflexia bacterium]|nr:rod-binding protein [Oligoflexia bacterium]
MKISKGTLGPAPTDAPVSAKGSKPKNEQLMEAARGFERQFIGMLVKEMRNTVNKSDFIPTNMAEKIFQDELDGHYVENWVGNGGIGLAEVIYDQVEQKYLAPKPGPAKAKGEMLPIRPTENRAVPAQRREVSPAPAEILNLEDGKNFLVKREKAGFNFLAPSGISSHVPLRSPYQGTVVAQSRLEDGRQTLVVRHDQGLLSQVIHNGVSHVKTGQTVAAGQPIVDLVGASPGAPVRFFFGLRKSSNPE